MFLPFAAEAQNEFSALVQEIIEDIAETTEEELDYTTLFSDLEEIAKNPYNLNEVTKPELEKLLFLTDYQIYSITKYRHNYNGFKTIYELAYVEGIDENTLRMLRPFVKVEPVEKNVKTNWKRVFGDGHHTVMARYQRVLQHKAGYNIPDSIIELNPEKNRYLGTQDKYYLKYNYTYKKKISYGLVGEKDEGEQFFKGAQKHGFDFYSAHFQLNDLRLAKNVSVKKVIVGDYVAQFGQGLTMWTGMGFGKSSGVMNIIKKSRNVEKYSSSNESAFMRGEAAMFQFGSVTVTEFVSYKSLDGAVSGTDTIEDDEERITSFLETGYHRTQEEIAKRHTIKEFVTGGNVTWRGENLKIGATGVYYSYSSPLTLNDKTYEYFNMAGKANANFGIDYLWSLHRITLFGETAMSPNGGVATLNGATFDFVPEFKMSLLHRYYSPQYQTMYALGFAEGSKTYNESGIFWGIEMYPFKHFRINAYVDAYKFPWLKYGVNSPSNGMEYLVQMAYDLNKKTSMSLRLKYEQKQKNSSAEMMIKELVQYSQTKIRYQLDYTPSNEWKFKSRIEYSRYVLPDSTSHGILLCEDLQYKPAKLPLTFTARIALFDTQDYNSRMYAYEPDVLYAFTVPMFYGKGTRLAFVVKYEILDNLDLWFRIANTYYADKTNIGTGLDEIQGNNRTEIKVQLRVKF